MDTKIDPAAISARAEKASAYTTPTDVQRILEEDVPALLERIEALEGALRTSSAKIHATHLHPFDGCPSPVCRANRAALADPAPHPTTDADAAKVLREALEAFVTAESMPTHKFVHADRAATTYEPSFQGGDCSEHGRWYGGGCLSCSDRVERVQELADEELRNARRLALDAAAQKARAALALLEGK